MKVKTYSINTFDAWLQTEGDDTSGSYVKYEDYAVLAAECAALKSAIEFADPWLPTCDEDLQHRIEMAKQTPDTDRIVAGIKADGASEFIGRLQQCVDEGDFVGDEVAVIVGAIDCGKEFCEQLREGADK